MLTEDLELPCPLDPTILNKTENKIKHTPPDTDSTQSTPDKVDTETGHTPPEKTETDSKKGTPDKLGIDADMPSPEKDKDTDTTPSKAEKVSGDTPPGKVVDKTEEKFKKDVARSVNTVEGILVNIKELVAQVNYIVSLSIPNFKRTLSTNP